MELPWFGVDCSPVKACRGDHSAPPTSGCATSEKLRPGSGQPVQRGIGLCFTFVSVSPASLTETISWTEDSFESLSPSIGLTLKAPEVWSAKRIPNWGLPLEEFEESMIIMVGSRLAWCYKSNLKLYLHSDLQAERG